MSNTVFTYNTTVRLNAAFSVSGIATDPTTVTLKVKTPANAISTYTYALAQVTKSATGIYYKDVQLTVEGVWQYRWEGTGAVAAAYLNSLECEAEW